MPQRPTDIPYAVNSAQEAQQAKPRQWGELSQEPRNRFLGRNLPDKEVPDWLLARSSVPSIECLLSAAVKVANYVELKRRIPETVSSCGWTLNMAQFAAASLDLITYGHTNLPYAELVPPVNLYVPADYSAVSAEAWSREEYLQHFVSFATLAYEANSGFSSIDGIRNAKGQLEHLRFVELVYHISLLLRHAALRGRLPPALGRFVVNPEGLVPWPLPAKHQDFLSVLDNKGALYARYPSHRLEVFQFALSIATAAMFPHNPYLAGYEIFKYTDWDSKQISYNLAALQFGNSDSGSAWDAIRQFWCNSTMPPAFNHLLFRAVGIPSSRSGSVFYLDPMTPEQLLELKAAGWGYVPNSTLCGGWMSMDQHSNYGSQSVCKVPSIPTDFLTPASTDTLLTAAKGIASHSNSSPAAHSNFFIALNGYDVLQYGADYVCAQAKRGGFRGLLLTVRDARGKVFFDTPYGVHEDPTVLTRLLDAAATHALKVRVAVSTLAWDGAAGAAVPSWAMRRNQIPEYKSTSWLPTFVSPCVDEHFQKLEESVQTLASLPGVDGVLFFCHYYPNLDGELPIGYDWNEALPSLGHPNAINLPNSFYCTKYMWPYSLLVSRLRQLVAKISSPRVSTSVGAYFEPTWPAVTPSTWDDVLAEETLIEPFVFRPRRFGYQLVPKMQEIVDEVMYTIGPSSWTSINETPEWLRILKDHMTLTSVRPSVSFYFLDEWLYDDEVYRGLFRRAANFASSVMLHASPCAASSRLGQPAYTSCGWKTIGSLDL